MVAVQCLEISRKITIKREGKMLNQCNFIGRLGKEPESRFTQSGKQVVNFSLAVSEKRNGEEKTEWINVICWENTAKFVADYMRKGSLCFVSGKMQTRKWQDKDGADRYSTEITLQGFNSVLVMLDSAQGNERSGGNPTPSQSPSPSPSPSSGGFPDDDLDSDVPF